MKKVIINEAFARRRLMFISYIHGTPVSDMSKYFGISDHRIRQVIDLGFMDALRIYQSLNTSFDPMDKLLVKLINFNLKNDGLVWDKNEMRKNTQAAMCLLNSLYSLKGLYDYKIITLPPEITEFQYGLSYYNLTGLKKELQVFPWISSYKIGVYTGHTCHIESNDKYNTEASAIAAIKYGHFTQVGDEE